MKTIYILALILSLITSNALVAQELEISYSYDDAGNRISRILIEPEDPPMSPSLKDSISTETLQDSTTQDVLQNKVVNKSYPPKVYPNPTSDFVNIELPFKLDRITNSVTDISLYDNKGTLVLHTQTNDYKAQLYISPLSVGQYKLLIKDGSQKYQYNIQKY